MVLVRSLHLVLLVAFLNAHLLASGPQAPTGLMCNLLAQPELTTIDQTNLNFSWIVNDQRRGAKQTAYQILVASDLKTAHEKRGDVWDSGKVIAGQSVQVRFKGVLPATGSYYWCVKTWDADDHSSPFSEPQLLRFQSATRPANGVLDPSVFANRYPIVQTRIKPVRLESRANGFCFVDFGKAAFGTIEIKVSSKEPGRVLEVGLGEVLTDEGRIDQKPGGSRRYRKMTVDLKQGTHTYLVNIPSDARNSSGAAIKVKEFMPDVLPFRYCELNGLPEKIKSADIQQVTCHYRFNDDASSFSSSSQVLNDVWNLCKYSIKATSFTGVYIDGDRERIPYEGDAYINQLSHYCVDREYSLARYSTEYLLAHPTWPAEWQMHMPLMAWADYLYTGDDNLLSTRYEALAAKTLQALAREDGLIVEDKSKMTAGFKRSLHLNEDIRVLVDWPASSKANPSGERDGYDMRPVNAVANAFHYRTLVVMQHIAEVLGKTAEAKRWATSAARVQKSFNAVFFEPQRRCYIDGEGSQHSALHANMFVLAFGLVPEERVSGVVEFIESRGMACSVYGAQHLLDGLYEAGAGDYALSLLTATNDRSWNHMQKAGSTITMEAWDNKYKENQDWNHAWGAAPANIIPRCLMGIQPIAPGFERVRIRPQLGTLEHAQINYPTIRGPIQLKVTQRKSSWSADVVIPANTIAELYVPTSERATITESKQSLDKSNFVRVLRKERGCLVVEMPAGTYHLESTR